MWANPGSVVTVRRTFECAFGHVEVRANTGPLACPRCKRCGQIMNEKGIEVKAA